MAVGPKERTSASVVVSNVAHGLTSQIRHRPNDASRDDTPFYRGEPQLDLIQPRAVREKEMEPQSRMFLQERHDRLGLLSREVVHDDVDLLAGRFADRDLTEKRDELCTLARARGLALFAQQQLFLPDHDSAVREVGQTLSRRDVNSVRIP